MFLFMKNSQIRNFLTIEYSFVLYIYISTIFLESIYIKRTIYISCMIENI